jgi:CarD family transcriptional regulator
MRGVSPPFHGGASAPARKTFPTPSAGEDKKLSKRSEHPDTTATSVAAEKTSIESKSAPKAAAPIKAKPANGSKLGFKLNEFIVYPAHGVGQIIGVETQEVAGFSLELFVVSFIKDKMILKVPTSKVANVGMRKLAEANVVDKALGTLSGRARIKRTMWSRRAQEYEAKINSGDLVTIAEVVRDLYRSDTQPEQSYSERQLYEAALDRMAREVAAVRKLIDSEALKLIESFLQKGPRRGQKADADVAEVDDAEEADEEDVDRAA